MLIKPLNAPESIEPSPEVAPDPWEVMRKRLMRHASMVVHSAAQAEDLVQETLMAMFEQADEHRGEASRSTWAIAILKNKIADWYRSPHQKRRVHVSAADEKSTDDPLEALYDAEGSHVEAVPAWQQPDGKASQRQMMVVMESCLRRLPAQSSKVFMMREWLGFESAEIGQRLDLSQDNIRTVLHRTRASLRQCMSAQGHSVGSVT
jgi:RNA polymerase sigma-70 factor (ECF subfamily)